ncbi:MAG: hypothetical protein F4196_09170 [Acidimicrobiia bacterium]|nr:hypothetical protein [Acidimicrobiia bacterium]
MSVAMVIGHPCSFRGRMGSLEERTPVAAVTYHHRVPAQRWTTGFFNRMPLPGLPLEEDFHVVRLDRFGLAVTSDLMSTERVACLSHTGVNQLQQRLVFHQTRLLVPTARFHEAFDHTYEEADLLEEWNTELQGTVKNPESFFEVWICQGDPTRQSLLRTPQDRAHVRREMRREIRQMQGGENP